MYPYQPLCLFMQYQKSVLCMLYFNCTKCHKMEGALTTPSPTCTYVICAKCHETEGAPITPSIGLDMLTRQKVTKWKAPYSHLDGHMFTKQHVMRLKEPYSDVPLVVHMFTVQNITRFNQSYSHVPLVLHMFTVQNAMTMKETYTHIINCAKCHDIEGGLLTHSPCYKYGNWQNVTSLKDPFPYCTFVDCANCQQNKVAP